MFLYYREYILPSENIFSKTNANNKFVILINNDLEIKLLVSINKGIECILLGLISITLIIINVWGIVYKCTYKKNIPTKFDVSKLSTFRSEKSYINNPIRFYCLKLIVLLFQCPQNFILLNTNLP